MPRISIIIPTYNNARYLDEALESIYRQTFRNYEIIIVDDGSTDDTQEVLARHAGRIRSLRQKNSGGCSKPRNEGIKLARGKYIAIFDADDLMQPDKLKLQAEFLDSQPGIDFVFTDFRNFQENEIWQPHAGTCRRFRHYLQQSAGKTDHGVYTMGEARDDGCCRRSQGAADARHRPASYTRVCEQADNKADVVPCDRLPGNGQYVIPAREAYRLLLYENYIGASSMMFRRTLLEMVGWFDESLPSSEDLDFTFRVTAGCDIGFIDYVGHLRRLHDASMSNRVERVLKLKIAVRERQLSVCKNSEAQRQLERIIGLLFCSLGRFYKDNGLIKEALNSYLQAWRICPGRLDTYRGMVRTFLPARGRW